MELEKATLKFLCVFLGVFNGVSITCMQTNVQWPAYVASRYPLWPSEPVCPLLADPSLHLRRKQPPRNQQNHNL